MFLWKHERNLLPKQAEAFGFTCVTRELPISAPICRSQLPELELCHYQKGNRERSNLTSAVCCRKTVRCFFPSPQKSFIQRCLSVGEQGCSLQLDLIPRQSANARKAWSSFCVRSMCKWEFRALTDCKLCYPAEPLRKSKASEIA